VEFSAAPGGAARSGDGGVEVLQRALADRKDEDQILFRRDGRVLTFHGLLEKIDENKVTFAATISKGQPPVLREFTHQQAYAAVLAQIGPAADRTGTALVQLADGSSVSGEVIGLADGKLSLQIARGVEAVVPWGDVKSAVIRSNRVAFLSDETPTESVRRPVLIAIERPWQPDRNVLGGVLTLGKSTFDKGIGVQSYSRLTFARAKEMSTFAATIGIDAAARGPAECVFVVEGDGREIFRQRVATGDAPRDVRLDIGSYDAMTLIVQPGRDLDMADYANWCDARFLKAAPEK
jgi:hypothetical protein